MENKNIKSSVSFFNKERICLLIIILATLLSYIQVTHYEFIHWDDNAQITQNQHVKNLNIQNIKYNLQHERYTSLTLTIFSLIYNFWGENPVPYHWINLLFHLFNIILVYMLMRKLSKNTIVIILVTLLFALHPMRVESVAWISEFKDLLFSFFSFISFHIYIKYLHQKKVGYIILTLLFIFLASLSKIQGLIIPFSLILFDYIYNRKLSLWTLTEKIIMFLYIFLSFNLKYLLILTITLFIVYIFFRNKKVKNRVSKKTIIITIITLALIILVYTLYQIIKFRTHLWHDADVSQNAFSIPERFLLAGYALWFYLSKCIFPFSLNAVHLYPLHETTGNLPINYHVTLIILAAVLIISIWLIVKRKKVRPLLFFGWFFFIFNISIVLHIIPIEGRLVVADRYSYLAYFGLFVALGELVTAYFKPFLKKYATPAFFVLLIILSSATYIRCMVWKNTKTLFTDVINKNPAVPFAYLNLATVYIEQQKIDSAMYCYSQSIKFDSLEPTVYFNRAYAYDMLGNNQEAIQDFLNVLKYDKHNIYNAVVYTSLGESYRKIGNDSLALYYYNLSIKTDSLLSMAYNNRGTFFLNKNMLSLANADFQKSIELDKYNASALNNFGWVLVLQGKFRYAIQYFNRSLASNPSNAYAYNNRGYAEFMLGDKTAALSDYNKALSINPRLIQAYMNRGWLWASIQNFKDAIDDFSQVLSMDMNNQLALNNRAHAWFSLKDYTKAFDDFNMNISLHPNSALVWQNMAWYHTELKNYDRAIKEFEKSLLLDSSLVNSYINLGWIWHQKKNYKMAEKYYKKAISIFPQSGDTWYFLAELYRENKNITDACDAYQKALSYGYRKANEALTQYCK